MCQSIFLFRPSSQRTRNTILDSNQFDIIGESKENTESSEQQHLSATADESSLLAKIPFELQTVDEKFLSEAVKLTYLSQSDLDQCHHKVILGLKKSCSLLTEEEISKLSVNLLNCQSAVEGRPIYPCTSDMTLQQCTKNMNQDTWNAYHIVSNRARAICYGSRQVQFRAKTEMAVNKLVLTAEQQLMAMNVLQEGQNKLGKVTEDTLESIGAGHRNLMLQQELLKNAQHSIQGYVASNLRQLTREKALIAAGQKELADMTDTIKQKLEKAEQQLTHQEMDRKHNHEEILSDLAQLQHKAKVVWDKIENSTQKILAQHVESAQHYQSALDNLKRVNHSITYLLTLVERMRIEIDSKLDWLTTIAGGAGNQLTMIISAALHLTYFLLGAIALSFIGAPTIARVALLVVVPLNALNEIRSGISLDFLALSAVIALSAILQWIVKQFGRTTKPHALRSSTFSMLTNKPDTQMHYYSSSRNGATNSTKSNIPEKPIISGYSDESDDEDITPTKNSTQHISQITNSVLNSVRKTFSKFSKTQKEEASDTSLDSDHHSNDVSFSEKFYCTTNPKPVDNANIARRHLLDAINDVLPQEEPIHSVSRSSTPQRSNADETLLRCQEEPCQNKSRIPVEGGCSRSNKMAVLSLLLRNVCSKLLVFRSGTAISTRIPLTGESRIVKDAIRRMGTHKRVMVITPSRFQWKKFKDFAHYYVMLGVIPLGLLISYTNIFIGPAELSEIPEGYHPQNWEYYKHPIQRFFARYIVTSDQEHYEKYMHFLCEEEEIRQMQLLEKKVRALMSQRGDYKGWYYRPVTGKYHRLVREESDKTLGERYGQN